MTFDEQWEAQRAAAATRQGLDPVSEALDAAGIEHDILNAGGWCMALVVPIDGGHAIVTGWDSEPGTLMVGAYAGTGWEDGDDPVKFAECVPTPAVLAMIRGFAANLHGPIL